MQAIRFAAALAFGLGSLATSATWAQVSVSDAWARPTIGEQRVSAAYMTLSSPRAARLVEARSPQARVEIHEMKMVGDVMKMGEIPALDLPAGQAVKLAPGGYHLMLMDLKQGLKAGDRLPLTLVFEAADRKRESVEVQATVRAPQGMGGHHDGHHGAMH